MSTFPSPNLGLSLKSNRFIPIKIPTVDSFRPLIWGYL